MNYKTALSKNRTVHARNNQHMDNTAYRPQTASWRAANRAKAESQKAGIRSTKSWNRPVDG